MPSHKVRIRAQWPTGLKPAIEAEAAMRGISPAAFVTFLVERGFYALANETAADRLEYALSELRATAKTGLSDPVISALAEMQASIRLIASHSGVSVRELDRAINDAQAKLKGRS